MYILLHVYFLIALSSIAINSTDTDLFGMRNSHLILGSINNWYYLVFDKSPSMSLHEDILKEGVEWGDSAGFSLISTRYILFCSSIHVYNENLQKVNAPCCNPNLKFFYFWECNNRSIIFKWTRNIQERISTSTLHQLILK